MRTKTHDALYEVNEERQKQDAKWGEQNHPDGTGEKYKLLADMNKDLCNKAAAAKKLTYRHILAEEVYEAFAEEDPKRLREELVQVAAVAVAWIEKIDRDMEKTNDTGRPNVVS